VNPSVNTSRKDKAVASAGKNPNFIIDHLLVSFDTTLHDLHPASRLPHKRFYYPMSSNVVQPSGRKAPTAGESVTAPLKNQQ
jgi:hypothetical protein